MRKIITFFLLLVIGVYLHAQEKTVTGTVLATDSNTPLPGVTVFLKGTTLGVITDLDGNFTIQASPTDTIQFSFVGYLTEEFAVGTQSTINVSLDPDILEMDEVVVVGYGTQKKSLVTGSIAKVDEESLNRNVPRVEQALQGKAAGVNIMQESGSPGAGLSVRIRGTSTNGNSNPLYIVDGMRTGGIDYLSPSDIESVEILKDAASAAIYGAEAGNGVILITTKSGKKGQTKSVVNYNFSYGLQQPGKINEVLNGTQYADYYRKATRHEIINENSDFEIPEDLLNRLIDNTWPYDPDTIGAGTDWLGEVFQTAPIIEHQLSISGGNEKTSVFASGSFYNQDGIVGGDKANFKRYTARLNVNHEVNNWLSLGTNVSFTHLNRVSIDENNEFGGVISNAMNIDPLTSVYLNDTSEFPDQYKQQIYDNFTDLPNSSLATSDGRYYGMSTLVQNEIRNPRAQLNNTHRYWTTDKLLGGVNAKITPIEGLVIKTDYSIDLSMGNNRYWTPRYYYHAINFNYTSNTGHDNHRWFNWQWENTATYTKQFGDHNLMLLAGTTAREDTYFILSGFGEVLQEESWNFAVLDAVQSDSTRKAANGGNRNADTRLFSYFGRAQYNYKERYMLDLILRADASSKLSAENRTQYFPSASFGWVLSNEDFWNVPVINFAKFRASWGQNGSAQSLRTFEYVSTIKSDAESAYYVSGGTTLTGSEPVSISNPDLIWETSQQTNFGLDLRFLNNKLTFTTDYYVKKTKDLITTAPIALYIGNNQPNANAGEVTNTGVELEFVYKDSYGEFNYNIGINGAWNKNEVTDMATPLIGSNLGTAGSVTRAEQGSPIWFFYGYETDGIFNSAEEVQAHVNADDELLQPNSFPGDVRFKDKNNDGIINDQDKTMIGSPHPDWTFGFNANLNYKGFDLTIFVSGMLGNEVYFGASRTDLPRNNKPLYFYEKGWTPENLSQEFPRYTASDKQTIPNFAHSDLFVFDGSHLRLQNLELGYVIPQDFSRRAGIDRLRFYVSGRNLFVLTSYPGSDPEVGNSNDSNSDPTMRSIGVDRGLFPKSKVFTFGLNLTL